MRRNSSCKSTCKVEIRQYSILSLWLNEGQEKAGDYSIWGFRIISCIWKLAGSRRLSGCWNEGKLLDSTGSRNTFGLHPRPLARLKMNSWTNQYIVLNRFLKRWRLHSLALIFRLHIFIFLFCDCRLIRLLLLSCTWIIKIAFSSLDFIHRIINKRIVITIYNQVHIGILLVDNFLLNLLSYFLRWLR